MPIRIDVDSREVDRLLSDVEHLDLRRPIGNAVRTMEQLIRQTFRDQVDPFGTPWKPPASTTIRRRQHEGRNNIGALFDTGAMFSSLHSEVTATGGSVVIGEGLPDERATANQFGTARAVARPFFPIRKDGTEALPDSWEDSVLRPFFDAIDDALG